MAHPLRLRERIPLRKQQLALFLLSAILVAWIVIGNAVRYVETQRDNVISYQELYSDQVAHATRQAYDTYKSIAYSVAYNQYVQDFIALDDTIQRYEAYQQVNSFLSNTLAINPNIVDITVYSP